MLHLEFDKLQKEGLVDGLIWRFHFQISRYRSCDLPPPLKKNWGIFEKDTGEKNDCFSILKIIPKFQTCIITCTIVIKIYTNPSSKKTACHPDYIMYSLVTEWKFILFLRWRIMNWKNLVEVSIHVEILHVWIIFVWLDKTRSKLPSALCSKTDFLENNMI